MARPDLLALTADDLAAFSNLGIVKRAQKELASGELTYELTETDDGDVTMRWSDNVECVLPANTPLNKSRCSCSATTVCRHLVRSVLAYQQHAPVVAFTAPTPDPQALTPGTLPPTPDPLPWNPGAISDETLAKFYSKAAINRARQNFEQGHVVELICSSKPTAHIHTLALTVRFLVEGNVQYTRCDCNEEAPCSHVLLAVWAFRQLPEGQTSGLISTRAEPLPVPVALLDELDGQLAELAHFGLSNVPQALNEQLRRLETRCRSDWLIWPAEIISEIIQQLERYTNRDALFAPERVLELLGELSIRSVAIRHETKEVPPLFVRGTASDKITELGASRLVGLGCGVEMRRNQVAIAAYVQNLESGLLMAIRREFSMSPEAVNNAPPFYELVRTAIGNGVQLGAAGAGQLLLKGGKRSASYQLMLGRTPLNLNPQTYEWEKLRPPVLIENFSELAAHLALLPPSSLRPRRLTENFFVCPVAEVSEVYFSPAQQAIIAAVKDSTGNPAWLIHPYTSRGAAGCEALLNALNEPESSLRFVAGHVRADTGGLVIAPVALVFEQAGRRTMLQPWVAALSTPTNSNNDISQQKLGLQPLSDPVKGYISDLITALSDLWLVGLARADGQTVKRWQNLLESGQNAGFVRLLNPVNALLSALQTRDVQLNWAWQPAASAMLDLALLLRLAQEELSAV